MSIAIILLCLVLGILLPSIQVPAPDGWRRRARKESMRRSGIIR